MNSLVRTTEPTADLFTLPQLQDYLRVSSSTSADDDILKAYMAAAVEWVEGVGGLSVMKQVWRLNLDRFPSNCGRIAYDDYWLGTPIKLPRGPVYSVDSVKYVDSNGALQTLDPGSYQVDKNCRPPAIYPAYGGYFPTARAVPGAVQVTYTAGMGIKASDGTDDTSAVRHSVKMAVRFLVAHWNENREPVPIDHTVAELPYALKAMLWALRIYRFDWESYYANDRYSA